LPLIGGFLSIFVAITGYLPLGSSLVSFCLSSKKRSSVVFCLLLAKDVLPTVDAGTVEGVDTTGWTVSFTASTFAATSVAAVTFFVLLGAALDGD